LSGADPAAVIVFGDPRLRRPCRPVEPGTTEAAALADRLWATLDARQGVGLAAPQIAVGARIFVARPPAEETDAPLELFNPVVEGTFGPVEVFEEGCLSFPGLYLEIERPRGVEIRYCDREGRERRIVHEGLLARILQHEIDHLDRTLFIDRLPRRRRWLLAPRLAWMAWTRGARS
jgi:peptide deformylase